MDILLGFPFLILGIFAELIAVGFAFDSAAQ